MCERPHKLSGIIIPILLYGYTIHGNETGIHYRYTSTEAFCCILFDNYDMIVLEHQRFHFEVPDVDGNPIRAEHIASFISWTPGTSEITQLSSVLSQASRHIGHVL